MSYRGFTIEQERDGSYSIFNLGYVAGHFSTIQAAKENIDWRMDYHGRGKRLPFIRSPNGLSVEWCRNAPGHSIRGQGPLPAEAHSPLVPRSLRNGAARWRTSQDGSDEQIFGAK